LPTIIDNLQRVRMLLGEPSKPEQHIIFEMLENQITHHLSQLQNSNANWSVNSVVVQGSSAVEDYLVPAGDFGKPFWVYWDNPTEIQWPRCEIPFSSLQNTDQFYSGPRAITPNSGGTVPTTSTISFYRKADAWWFRLTPVPGNSFPITIWYETLPLAPSNLQDTPGLTPFHHLIRVQTALSVLPLCQWDDVKPDAKEMRLVGAWDRMQRRLAETLARDEVKFQGQFSTYIGTLQQAGIEQREPFGMECDIDINSWSGTFGVNQHTGG
jgi:hypothetical protein